MPDAPAKRPAAGVSLRRVSVLLTPAEHTRFKAQAAILDMTMNEALHKAVIEYSSKLARAPLSEAEKAEQNRVNAITDAIELRAPELYKSDETFSARDFVKRLWETSTSKTKPNVSDLEFIGMKRVLRMVHQKAGTGTAFLTQGTGLYAVRHHGADMTKDDALPAATPTPTVPRPRRIRSPK